MKIIMTSSPQNMALRPLHCMKNLIMTPILHPWAKDSLYMALCGGLGPYVYWIYKYIWGLKTCVYIFIPWLRPQDLSLYLFHLLCMCGSLGPMHGPWALEEYFRQYDIGVPPSAIAKS